MSSSKANARLRVISIQIVYSCLIFIPQCFGGSLQKGKVLLVFPTWNFPKILLAHMLTVNHQIDLYLKISELSKHRNFSLFYDSLTSFLLKPIGRDNSAEGTVWKGTFYQDKKISLTKLDLIKNPGLSKFESGAT